MNLFVVLLASWCEFVIDFDLEQWWVAVVEQLPICSRQYLQKLWVMRFESEMPNDKVSILEES